MLQNDSQVSPRESLLHEWEVEDWDKRARHDLTVQRMKIEEKKLETKLKQEDATKARRHQQNMKELELAIREEEARWSQIYRLPILLIKLPLFILFGIAFVVATARGEGVDNNDFWKLLR